MMESRENKPMTIDWKSIEEMRAKIKAHNKLEEKKIKLRADRKKANKHKKRMAK